MLIEAGYLYHMDDFSDDVPRWESVEIDGTPRHIVVVPYALDTNDMKFWIAPGYTPAQWLDYAIASFDQLYEEGASQPKMMSLGVHLRIIGRPGRIGALASFMQVRRGKEIRVGGLAVGDRPAFCGTQPHLGPTAACRANCLGPKAVQRGGIDVVVAEYGIADLRGLGLVHGQRV